jgi:hypothetical protein
LDEKHVYRKTIIQRDAPSWLGTVEDMAKHYRPIQCPDDGYEYRFRAPADGDMLSFAVEEESEDLVKAYVEYMTDLRTMTKCL